MGYFLKGKQREGYFVDRARDYKNIRWSEQDDDVELSEGDRRSDIIFWILPSNQIDIPKGSDAWTLPWQDLVDDRW